MEEGAADSQKTPGRRAPEALTDPVVIGRVTAPHGVQGTVKVKAPGSGRHLRRGVEPLIEGERRRILAVRETPKGFLVDFEGIEDRVLASSLRGSELLLDREELDAPEEGEFYVGDLVGFAVYDEAGAYLGSVSGLFETPAHEVLVVRNESSEELYVPFTNEHVPTVDVEGGRVVVNLSEVLE